MTRGQSEYVGAVVLIALLAVIAYVATDWLSVIHSAAKRAVESIEHAREFLEVALAGDLVTVFNRGSRGVAIDLLYIRLANGTLVVRDVNSFVRPGDVAGLGTGFSYTDVDTVCVETANSNVFCGHDNRGSGVSVYRGFWSYERVSPRYLGPSPQNHVVYRVKRIVAPDTWFYVYAVPEENAVVAMFEEDILHTIGRYHVGSRPSDPGEGGYISVICTTCRVTPELLVDGDDGTAGVTTAELPNTLDMCIDLGAETKGWLYIYADQRGHSIGAQAVIAISNRSCNEIDIANITIHQLNSPTTIRGVWLINARSIRFYSHNYIWDLYTVEFYPHNTTKTVLSLTSAKHREPVITTISLFALNNTWLQMLELTMLPQVGNQPNTDTYEFQRG